MSTKKKQIIKKIKINKESYDKFNGLISKVITDNLIQNGSLPEMYEDTRAFLFSLENAKVAVLSSLKLAGIVKSTKELEQECSIFAESSRQNFEEHTDEIKARSKKVISEHRPFIRNKKTESFGGMYR